MIHRLIQKIIGTRNDRLLKRCRKIVSAINAWEPKIHSLSRDDLKSYSIHLKQRAQSETLDILLPEAFALVREASDRVLGLRHFDTQLIGGILIHQGKVAEMRTGEGKTLMSTLAAYLNSLSGKGVHIVTVNDYLVQRDAEWMRPIYELLDVRVGINLASLSTEEKRMAYAADVTYSTNNECGFDYLRNHMVFDLKDRVQRDLHYVIIDEVDSILIDEARTPLIISGQAEQSSQLYCTINDWIPSLKRQARAEEPQGEPIPESERGDYVLDEQHRQVVLTERGHQKVESLLAQTGLMRSGEHLYDTEHINLMHYVYAALRAHTLYQRDVHYLIKDEHIVIVDEHTGRLMSGRRWSDGLHQAVEAKEQLPIQLENQTLASITFQNYFRLYEKISGMTGTADTEAFELQKIYGLEVVVVPTHKPMIRKDLPDRVYLTTQGKYQAILEEIRLRHSTQQPILVGTASVESSELLSELLNQNKMSHHVLNAKHHTSEAKIIAQAGRPGAITIATNMAGRGTDIVLGGNFMATLQEHPEWDEAEQIKQKDQWTKDHAAVLAAGGLHILGTERNEARRIDYQLRGRAGRQGDPGSSQFYLSLEDNLLRIFAAERITGFMRKMGIKDTDVIESRMVSRSIENAQKRVERHNFDIRKTLLEYDDVANDQRMVVYRERSRFLEASDLISVIETFQDQVAHDVVSRMGPQEGVHEDWDVELLEQLLWQDFHVEAVSIPVQKDEVLMHHFIVDLLRTTHRSWRNQTGLESCMALEKALIVQRLDHDWKEHLSAMDHLRQGIHLRGYAQKNPTQEFKRESFALFQSMLNRMQYEVVAALSRLATQAPKAHLKTADYTLRVEKEQVRVGRNDLCPCGSKKRYKACHGSIA